MKWNFSYSFTVLHISKNNRNNRNSRNNRNNSFSKTSEQLHNLPTQFISGINPTASSIRTHPPSSCHLFADVARCKSLFFLTNTFASIVITSRTLPHHTVRHLSDIYLPTYLPTSTVAASLHTNRSSHSRTSIHVPSSLQTSFFSSLAFAYVADTITHTSIDIQYTICKLYLSDPACCQPPNPSFIQWPEIRLMLLFIIRNKTLTSSSERLRFSLIINSSTNAAVRPRLTHQALPSHSACNAGVVPACACPTLY